MAGNQPAESPHNPRIRKKRNAPWCLTAEYYLINVSAPRATHIVQWLSHRFRILIVGLDCTWGAPIHTGAHEKH